MIIYSLGFLSITIKPEKRPYLPNRRLNRSPFLGQSSDMFGLLVLLVLALPIKLSQLVHSGWTHENTGLFEKKICNSLEFLISDVSKTKTQKRRPKTEDLRPCLKRRPCGLKRRPTGLPTFFPSGKEGKTVIAPVATIIYQTFSSIRYRDESFPLHVVNKFPSHAQLTFAL